MDSELLLDCALDIGEQMVICGAEISRVEDTIERICRAYGAQRVDVFTITSCIITTVKFDDGRPITQTRRIHASCNDLTKLDKLNALSRYICETKPDCDKIRSEFKRLSASKSYPIIGQYANFALISASFSVFLAVHGRMHSFQV